MHKDANLGVQNDDLTDDDIVDLFEVVKQGKTTPEKSPDDSGEVDFSKSLEAMLNKLSEAAEAKDEINADEKLDMPTDAEVDNLLQELGVELDGLPPDAQTNNAERDGMADELDVREPAGNPDDLAWVDKMLEDTAAGQTGHAKPDSAVPVDLDGLPGAFKSESPVDTLGADLHAFPDPEELLKELFQSESSDAKSKDAPVEPADQGEDRFEALLREAEKAGSAHIASPAPVPGAAESRELADDMQLITIEEEYETEDSSGAQDDMLEGFLPDAGDNAAMPAGDVALGAKEDPAAGLMPLSPPEREPEAAPEVSAGPDSEPGRALEDDEATQDPAADFDEVDLNELDALLDDMLATAPPSGPVSPPSISLLAAKPAAEQALAGNGQDLGIILSRLDSLGNTFEQLDSRLSLLETNIAAQPQAAQEVSASDLAALREEVGNRVRELADQSRDKCDALDASVREKEQTIRELTAQLAEASSRIQELTAQSVEANAKIQELTEQAAESITRIQELTEEGLELQNSLEATQASLGSLRTSMDKMAAEAAAKVIREEIAALLADAYS